MTKTAGAIHRDKNDWQWLVVICGKPEPATERNMLREGGVCVSPQRTCLFTYTHRNLPACLHVLTRCLHILTATYLPVYIYSPQHTCLFTITYALLTYTHRNVPACLHILTAMLTCLFTCTQRNLPACSHVLSATYLPVYMYSPQPTCLFTCTHHDLPACLHVLTTTYLPVYMYSPRLTCLFTCTHRAAIVDLVPRVAVLGEDAARSLEAGACVVGAHHSCPRRPRWWWWHRHTKGWLVEVQAHDRMASGGTGTR